MKGFRALFTAVLALLLPMQAAAQTGVDLQKQVKLSVRAQWAGEALPGIPVQLFRISTMDASGSLTTETEFAAFSEMLDIHGDDPEKWQAAARSLEEYIVSEGLSPDAVSVTNEAGVAEFPVLPQGLYLVPGTVTQKDGWVYTTAPFFLLLPAKDPQTNDWLYTVTAEAKVERNPERISLRVVKLWFDKYQEHLRPEQIRLGLYRDGKLYEVITLPENGKWEYTWDDLEAVHRWTVEEEPVEGYTSTLERQGNLFILRNYCQTGAETEKLPQTGQLWWPVPVLTAAGLLLVLLGLLAQKGKGHKK